MSNKHVGTDTLEYDQQTQNEEIPQLVIRLIEENEIAKDDDAIVM